MLNVLACRLSASKVEITSLKRKMRGVPVL